MLETDQINTAVGLSEVVRLGTKVAKGDPLAVIHAVRSEDAEKAAKAVRSVISLSDKPIASPDLILERVG
jgi:thymidine phosphorylase